MILLLGGTIDSRQIAKELTEQQIPFILTTVSEYGKKLALEVSDCVENIVLDPARLKEFLTQKGITTVIDATHPFAKAASENAIVAATEAGLSYFRFERPGTTIAESKGMIFVKDIASAQKVAMERAEVILLTTGSRGLSGFTELVNQKTVYARVLPDITSIRACEEAGIPTGQIIAMQGPFSYEANALLIKEKKIDLLITKESGSAGGTQQKIAAAIDAGIECIIISRPDIMYPVVFEQIDALLNALQK